MISALWCEITSWRAPLASSRPSGCASPWARWKGAARVSACATPVASAPPSFLPSDCRRTKCPPATRAASIRPRRRPPSALPRRPRALASRHSGSVLSANHSAGSHRPFLGWSTFVYFFNRHAQNAKFQDSRDLRLRSTNLLVNIWWLIFVLLFH